MNNQWNTVACGLIYNYQDFGRRVHPLAEQLTEEQFWIKPYPYGNSFGNLVLHLTGNLSYYIGAQLANTEYIREREREFTESQIGRKREVLKKLDDAVELVIATLKSQYDDDWEKEYNAAGVDDVKDRSAFIWRSAVHFHHHIGQMICLVKELTKAS